MTPRLLLPSRARTVAATALLVLSACGGGGDSSDADAAPVTLPPTGTDTSAYIGDCNVANFVAGTLQSVNQFRSQARTCGSTTYPAAAALVWNNALAQAAEFHSKDMAARNYFAHTSPQGVTLSARIDATGYAWSAIGENIAAGVTTMADVMAGWQASPGHCANLMNATYTQIGMSCKRGTGTTYQTYWTMDLAKPR